MIGSCADRRCASADNSDFSLRYAQAAFVKLQQPLSDPDIQAQHSIVPEQHT